MKLGDAIATVATPIARALQMPCIDPVTNQLRLDSGCAQRKEALNRLSVQSFSNTIYDLFWEPKEKGAKVQYIIVKQITVEGETPEDALSKINEGRTIGININERPQAQGPRVQTPVQPAQPRPS